MKRVFQFYDETGAPQGGHVHVAPDEASLGAQITPLPAGWRRDEVADEAALVFPPEILPTD
jgi:hypothetical protein